MTRRYLKRVWRVPKTRGPAEYLATLCVKALRKHGWPAEWEAAKHDPTAFWLVHDQQRQNLPPDFAEAVAIAVRVVAKAYRVDVTETEGFVQFNRFYRVTDPGGHFKELLDEDTSFPR